VRPVWWEFPEPRFIDIDDRAMLGPALFIVPFLAEAPHSVVIQFPADARWYSYSTLAEVSQQETILEFNSGRTAVFLRGGSIVPIKRKFQKATGFMKQDPVTLLVALDSTDQAIGELYIDDEDTFDFARNSHLQFQFVFRVNVLTGRITHGDPTSEFARSHNAVIDLIRITHLSTPLPKALFRGTETPTEFDNGILSVETHIPLNANFNIHFITHTNHTAGSV
jgi:alpha 1,3-glucosidase